MAKWFLAEDNYKEQEVRILDEDEKIIFAGKVKDMDAQLLNRVLIGGNTFRGIDSYKVTKEEIDVGF